ncbi:MAG TPA: Stk1 family PASTA domain-containing Ser/Thr kinase [Armatimonadota bacterium]|nr:Stk1 family PASTA domain-containing Ser/Thr kinase [Armatimonadota bacterium]
MTHQVLNERYVVEERVGEGGMAVTYRARDLLLNRTVAVKIMRDQYTTDPHFVERFRREAQAAARLSHPHIAGIYDTGLADGQYFIVMEFVEGTDLKQRVRRDGALPIPTAIEIARQITAALEASHKSGLIHRDIKPHNILLTRDGTVKVTDFGIAKLVTDGEDTGVILASVHYVSPEHVRGETTTPCSDLYSLGCVLYEMLTGHTVFDGDSALAIAHKQVYEQPPAPRALRPEISPALEAVVLRCLEKDPQARYQSAAELLSVLSHLLLPDTESTVLLPAPPAPADATVAVQRPVRRERPPAEPPPPRGSSAGSWIIVILFLIFAGVVGYGGYQVFYGGHEVTPPPPGKKVMPDLLGMEAVQAKALLASRDLTATEMRESNDDIPEGQVCRQEPAARTVLSDETPILYWISDGPSIFAMPDVTQMSQDAAKRRIREEGYKGAFAMKKEQSDDVPKGTVIRTEPEGGAMVQRAATVTLVLSDGAQQKMHGVYRPGSAPLLPGAEHVYVRIEIENPVGSEPVAMWYDTLKSGDPIPDQHFDYTAGKRVLVRMLVGPDEMGDLEQYEEKFYGPPAP